MNDQTTPVEQTIAAADAAKPDKSAERTDAAKPDKNADRTDAAKRSGGIWSNPANQLTMTRIFLVPVFVACFYLRSLIDWWNILAAAVFLIANITDILDGRYARKHNLCSDFGRLMDPMADKLLQASAFILLQAFFGMSPILTLIFIGRELIVSAFRLVTAQKGAVIAASWLGKTKTLVQAVAVIAVLLENPIFSLINVPFDQICLYAAAFFTVWSGADYLIKNWKLIG